MKWKADAYNVNVNSKANNHSSKLLASANDGLDVMELVVSFFWNF